MPAIPAVPAATTATGQLNAAPGAVRKSGRTPMAPIASGLWRRRDLNEGLYRPGPDACRLWIGDEAASSLVSSTQVTVRPRPQRFRNVAKSQSHVKILLSARSGYTGRARVWSRSRRSYRRNPDSRPDLSRDPSPKPNRARGNRATHESTHV